MEVSYEGDWGTVCRDHWDHREIMVVCRSLGYKYAMPILAWFGEGIGEIFLDDLSCEGDELTLSECPNLNWGVHNCDHSYDVGVVCSSKLHAIII